LPTASHFLGPDGTVRTELFGDDKLHLNQDGYDLWSELIRRRLDDIFRVMVAAPPEGNTRVADQE
jgi:lysophospholipase L1-like esterase